MNKHYIRLDENNFIIKGFSDAFEQPLETDICINENCGRHFSMFGEINLSLQTIDGISKYKYLDGEVVEVSVEELESIKSNIKPPISETEKIWDTVNYLINSSYEV